MRALVLFLTVVSIQAFAADVIGDGKITAHDGSELQVFKPRKMTELERRRVHIRNLIAERMCHLAFWTGKATGAERCLTAIAKEETVVSNDPSHKPDLEKIVSEIKVIRELDELQDADNPNLKDAMAKLAVYSQAQISVLESINIEELEARGMTEYAEIALNIREIQLLNDVKEAVTGNFGDVYPEQAKKQIEKDISRIRELESQNQELMAKIKAKVDSHSTSQNTPADESVEDAARRALSN